MGLLKECEKLLRSIAELARQQIDRGSSRAHIHHVPKDLREGNELQYEPRIISIGPLHFTSTRLTQGQEIKHAYFHDFCSRCFGKQMTELRPIIQGLKEMEEHVRPFYGDIDDDRKMCSDEFVKMMLIDGCFILELLWRQHDYTHKKDGPTYQKKDDRVFHSSGMVKIVVRDLFLFENQLPYFLIDYLFVSVSHGYEFQPNLYPYLKSLVRMVTGTVPSSALVDNVRASAKHLLEFAWHFVIDQRDIGIKENSPEKALRCAKSVSELKQYGMKLYRNEDKSGHFLPAKIRNNGKLEMGVIELDELKSSLFWNLLAFEQLADTKRVYLFQSFILFMNSLIKVENDVNLLCSRDIIINGMNDSAQVVKLFNCLAQKVNRQDITRFYYHDFFMDMDTYCRSRIPRFRAYLMHNYYDARWDVLNALLLFILTFTQTFFSIISYKK